MSKSSKIYKINEKILNSLTKLDTRWQELRDDYLNNGKNHSKEMRQIQERFLTLSKRQKALMGAIN